MMHQKEEEVVKIKVGEAYIEQDYMAKLGVQVDAVLGWKEQVHGKGGRILLLNQQTHLIKQLRNHICKEKLRKIVDSLWTSKLRYGLQLWATA